MTDQPDLQPQDDHPDSPIVISGLDESATPPGEEGDTNTTPTDEAVQRLQSQRARGEPEDEDG